MVDKFSEQLVHRIQAARSDSALVYYALYVRLVRSIHEWDRAELSRRTGLDRSFIAFLENNRLLPNELTKEVREKIEQTFGISYRLFWEQNRKLMEELREDLERSNSTAQKDSDKTTSGDENCSMVQISFCDQGHLITQDLNSFWRCQEPLPSHSTSQALAEPHNHGTKLNL